MEMQLHMFGLGSVFSYGCKIKFSGLWLQSLMLVCESEQKWLIPGPGTGACTAQVKAHKRRGSFDDCLHHPSNCDTSEGDWFCKPQCLKLSSNDANGSAWMILTQSFAQYSIWNGITSH
ncbi:hypothetical protein O6P43_028769 [Quillaja saponaria]|uniref:Uncharacterized protein n=1 Tax=Quillaja saponaria TaxID=32244 RepID=A0AAD7L0G1_QUISA|nr:hypothetical protein O6P43_028769 [Quillaja saponaria]